MNAGAGCSGYTQETKAGESLESRADVQCGVGGGRGSSLGPQASKVS